ncbi:MAG TPA: pilus assembly protein TadG-related protein [Candidatus Binatia bacterium]|nr:pilus assembly protein TadG-related protein [Candidatus Binatia bacterium]
MKIKHIMKRAGCGTEGQVLVWTSLMLVILLGFLALAMDGGFFYQHKRQMQTAADSAALAGAHDVKRDSTITQAALETSARSDATLNGFTHGTNGIVVDVYRPPTSGYYAGNNSYVEAVITHPHRTFFARILNLLGPGINFNTATVRARAVAGLGSGGEDCIYVLHDNKEKAFEISSNSHVNAQCGVQVNSTNRYALSVTSNAYLNATTIDVTGGVQNESPSNTITGDLTTSAPAAPDPLAYMKPPSIPSNTITQRLYEGTQKLSPGYYPNGIELNSANVTLEPGLYVVNMTGVGEDALKVKSGSTLTGTGVTFYFTGSSDKRPVSIESGSTAKLSAMTNGDMAGMLFFRRENNSTPLLAEIASNSESYFEGVIYFPNDRLRFHSGVDSGTNSGAKWTALVSKELEVSSNTRFNVNADTSSVPNPLASNTRLVE